MDWIKILEVAAKVAIPWSIAAVAGAIVAYWISYRIALNREEIRKLRSGLESEPSPGLISKALSLWPDASKYPEKVLPDELKRRALVEEAKRAQAAEVAMTVVRLFAALAVIGALAFAAGMIWKP